jgi:hypothetical protein
MNLVKSSCAIISAVMLASTTSAYAAKDKSRETPGIAAHQATQGAFKRDRKITRHILRREHEERVNESRHCADLRFACDVNFRPVR